MELSERELKVLFSLASGRKRAKEIVEKTKIPKPSLYRILKNLEEKGLITKENGEYRLTILGRRLLTEGEMRVHNAKVVLQALEVNLHVAVEKGKEVNVNNWNCYHLDLSRHGIPAKAQVNVAEKVTIVLHLPEFRAKSIYDAFLTIQNMVAKCRRALQIEGLITEEEWLDYSFKIKYHEYAWKLPPYDPSEPIEVDLGYRALNPQGEILDYNAKAWIDESLGYKELEANDSLYAYKRVMEPIWVEEIKNDVKKIDKKVNEVHNILEGFNAEFGQTLRHFITAMNQFNQTFTSWNEMITSFTESQKALSKNIQEHIQLVSSVTGIAKDISKTAKEQANLTRSLMISQILLTILLTILMILLVVMLWRGV